MIKYQIFVNKHLPAQTSEINISKKYSICSNLSIKILQQCHSRNGHNISLYVVLILFILHAKWYNVHRSRHGGPWLLPLLCVAKRKNGKKGKKKGFQSRNY